LRKLVEVSVQFNIGKMFVTESSVKEQGSKFVSIIVPVYNVEKYLPGCLDSLLFRQGADLEVIAINDCSLDGSASVLESYQRKSSLLKVINHQVNQGVSAARNTGVNAASGEYLLFVDADDKLADGAVEQLKKAVMDGDPDIVMFSHRKVSETGEVLSVNRMTDSGLFDLTQRCDMILAFDGFVGSLLAWNGLYKRQRIGDLRFLNYSNGEDVLFGVQAFCRARIVCKLSAPLYDYLQRSESASKVRSYRHCHSSISVCAEIFDSIKKMSYYQDVRRMLFRKLRAMSHGLILNVLMHVPVEDKAKCWNEWFESFHIVYCCSDIVPVYKRPMYKFVIGARSPFLALVCFKLMANLKACVLRQKWMLKSWTKLRKLRLVN